jgi:DNA-binding LacI/PurR family transcriptional regulator
LVFVQFCNDKSLSYQVIRSNSEWQGVEENAVYLCISPDDLVKIIKDANSKKLKIGKEIGLIAYNDDPVLEVIKDGISSISIDFGLMGEKAANFVTTKKLIQEYLPTQLILRGSI